MKCSLELSEETAKLFISGSLTIEDAAHLKTTLSGALAESASIEVDMGAVEYSDLSCLQVLCSAHRAAVQTGKKFILQNTGMTLIACLEDAGFPRQAGCLQQYGEACLWQEENLP